jgi:soluble lytic murein transglycosylase-like protein
MLATAKNLAMLRHNDPSVVQEQEDIGAMAIRSNTKGLPPEQVNAQVQAFRSDLHKGIVLRMATDNPLAAQKYYQEHADAFTADDNVALQRTLAPTVKRAESRVEGEKIIREVTETKAAAPEALHAAVESVESGGRGDAVSPKDAKGVMQVLDSTGEGVAKKLGIPWRPELMAGTTAEAKAYQRKIGGAYLDEQLEKYGGNRTLALAAYNAGPGMVDDWINGTNRTGKNEGLVKLGDPRTGEVTDAAWAGRVPFKETRGYIARVEAKIRGGAQDNIDLTRSEEIIQERYADDPEKQDLVRGHIQRQNSLREQARRDREQEAWRKGLAHIDNGGSVDNLPPDVLENLPPGRAKDLEAKEASRIRGTDKPDNPAEFNRLMTLSVNDPEAFFAEDPTKWELPRAQVGQLITRKGSLMAGDEKEKAKALDVQKAVRQQSMLLRSAGIDPTPKDKDKAGADRMNAFTAALAGRMDEFRAREGRRPDEAEVTAMSRDLLLPGRLSYDYWPDSEKLPFEVKPEESSRFYVPGKYDVPFKDIPEDSAKEIILDLNKAGIPVTNERVAEIYSAVKRGDVATVRRLNGQAAPK